MLRSSTFACAGTLLFVAGLLGCSSDSSNEDLGGNGSGGGSVASNGATAGSGSGQGSINATSSAATSGSVATTAGAGGGFAGTGGGSSAASGTASGTGAGSSAGNGGNGGGGFGPDGVLTAGDWDDNLNFAFYQSFIGAYRTANPNDPTYASADRVVVKVVDGQGAPVSGAQIVVAQGQKTLLDTTAGGDGQTLFFPKHDGAASSGDFSVSATSPDAVTATLAAPTGTTWTVKLTEAHAKTATALDVAFVLDTTGSMGDELSYLQNEINGIGHELAAELPGVSIRYGLVLYRDQGMGDAYTTRFFDFTSDLSTFTSHLGAQSADGGGDTPEAVELGVETMNSLSWKEGNVARVAFLVGDAPPHTQNGAAYFDAIDAARTAGVRIYPIGASGVDGTAEYYFRTGAEASGGRYLFLTDDSGVGGSHAIPHTPCYDVEKLSLLIERMLASEIAGQRIAPSQADIIREVGQPTNGVCTLPGGIQTMLY